MPPRPLCPACLRPAAACLCGGTALAAPPHYDVAAHFDEINDFSTAKPLRDAGEQSAKNAETLAKAKAAAELIVVDAEELPAAANLADSR